MPVSAIAIRHLVLATVDLSEYIQNVTLRRTVQTRGFFDGGEPHRMKTGLRTDVVTGRLTQDRDAGKVGATIRAEFESDSSSAIVLRPSTAAKSATNEEYTGKVLVAEYMPITGQRGEIEGFAFTWTSAEGPFAVATT